jgi:hypothetical protein
MGKKSGSGSGMNHLDHISESLETIFWVKILKFFDADPGWKNLDPGSEMGKNRIRDKHPGSATLSSLYLTVCSCQGDEASVKALTCGLTARSALFR